MYLTISVKNCCKFFSFLLIVSFVFSCKPGKPKKGVPQQEAYVPFAEQLKTVMSPIDSVNKKGISSVGENMRYTYQSADYAPIWLKENIHPTAAAEQLLAELEDLKWDGLDPENYNVSRLKLLKIKLDTTKVNTMADALMFDTALTYSYLAAARDLLIGKVIPKKVDSLWYHSNDSAWKAPEWLVEAKTKYRSLDSFRSATPTYALLRDEYKRYYNLAVDSDLLQVMSVIDPLQHPDSEMMECINIVVKAEMPWLNITPNDSVSEEKQMIMAYQRYMGLPATGKTDSSTLAHMSLSPDTMLIKIKANLERIRWMKRDYGNLYVVVNIPLMELFLRKDGANLMHMRVVVGKQARQTPSLNATMANIVINPPWGVPPTILKNDVVPGFQKSGKSYLAKKGLRAYTRDGKPVNAAMLNMKNLKRYTYKQAPGNDNALGYVKFNLPNPWDIYLHDTPHRTDFGKRDRALSSGCIRLEQPQQLALLILGQLEKRDYTQEKLDAMIKTHKTRWELLKTKIPVFITYLTAFEDTTGAHIQYVKDVYHRDDKLISWMAKK